MYSNQLFGELILMEQVLPHPPVLRAMDTVVSTLKKNGHHPMEWTPYNHDFAVDLINGIFAADGSTVSNLLNPYKTPS